MYLCAETGFHSGVWGPAFTLLKQIAWLSKSHAKLWFIGEGTWGQNLIKWTPIRSTWAGFLHFGVLEVNKFENTMLAKNNNLLTDCIEAILECICIWIYASSWGQTSHFQGVSYQNIEEYKDIDYKNITKCNRGDTHEPSCIALSQA